MRSACDGRAHRFLALLVLLVLSQLALPGIARAQSVNLTDADRDLLVRVRQAGLWEMPAGDWARTRAANQHVKEVGMTLMVDHGRLDVAVRDIAARFNVRLPDQPTADQQNWLREMQNAPSASDFERVFANRLRAAHGVIFSVIAGVRAGTRNDDIRAFAATANQVVLRHITLLESTGLVDFNQLPQPALSSTAATSAASALNISAMDLGTSVVLALLLCAATVLLLWLIRHNLRRKTRSGDDKDATAREPEKRPAA